MARVIKRDSWNIGMRRVNKVIDQERKNGFKAVATGIYSSSVDILVYDKKNRLVRVYESTNQRKPKFFIPLSRANRYKNNLLSFNDVQKILICSFETNLRYLPGGRDFFEQHGIEVRVMDGQD